MKDLQEWLDRELDQKKHSYRYLPLRLAPTGGENQSVTAEAVGDKKCIIRAVHTMSGGTIRLTMPLDLSKIVNEEVEVELAPNFRTRGFSEEHSLLRLFGALRSLSSDLTWAWRKENSK